MPPLCPTTLARTPHSFPAEMLLAIRFSTFQHSHHFESPSESPAQRPRCNSVPLLRSSTDHLSAMLPACDTLPSGPRDPWPRPPPLAVQTRNGEGSDPPRARRACVSDEVAAQIFLEASDAAMEEVFTKERLREEWRCAIIVYGGRPGRHTPRGARLSQQHIWFNVCDFIRLSTSHTVAHCTLKWLNSVPRR